MGATTIRRFVAVLALPLMVACADPDGGRPGGSPPDHRGDEVRPLVKAEGWRDGLIESLGQEQPYALVELAFDEQTAQRAWDENVPHGLEPGTGAPDEPGQYGDLEGVDFETHAVVVWSSGESGSCPGWLDGIATDGEGIVKVTTDQRGSTCTDDYNPYRMVLVAHRDLLPEPTWLPIDEVMLDGRSLEWGSVVREYPTG